MSDIRETKASLRRQVSDRLKAMTPAARREGSTRAVESLAAQAAWRDARSVLLYAPMEGELDIWPLAALALAEGKTLALPRYHAPTNTYAACMVRDLAADIRTGFYGIREPVEHCQKLSLKQLDLILVPGVAFDAHGRRLGRGKGYYDRLLAGIDGIRCGVGFDEQVVPEVPVAAHDISVNCILTPTRWLVL